MTVTPRYNFYKVFGLMWLSALIVSYFSLVQTESFYIPLLLFLTTPTIAFLNKKKFARTVVTILLCLVIISSFSSDIPLCIFLISLILLMFNQCSSIELLRPQNREVDYYLAVPRFPKPKRNSFENTINPLYLFSIIMLCPCIYTIQNLWHFNIENILNGHSIAVSNLLIFITFGLSGIGFSMKQKWSRLCTIIAWMVLVYCLKDVYSVDLGRIENQSYYNIILVIIGTFSLSFSLLIYHPIIDYYFMPYSETAEEYDKILDLE